MVFGDNEKGEDIRNIDTESYGKRDRTIDHDLGNWLQLYYDTAETDISQNVLSDVIILC